MERLICFKAEDWEKKYIEKACTITNTEPCTGNYIEMNFLLTLLEDLVSEYDKLQEDYGDLEERFDDRYGKE